MSNETFNCIECNDFALCFLCAALPQKVKYKHDEHILSLCYGEETSTVVTYWCEACEKEIDPDWRFYRCIEYCCVTLHIKCLIGKDLYMKSGSSFLYAHRQVSVLSNSHHMSRPICPILRIAVPRK
uniref:DC1 domain-containing protein n=1 Tax=Brassica campestris TaxID=3711 RepID=M4D7F0_BRACM